MNGDSFARVANAAAEGDEAGRAGRGVTWIKRTGDRPVAHRRNAPVFAGAFAPFVQAADAAGYLPSAAQVIKIPLCDCA
jgi:hypothetical protein